MWNKFSEILRCTRWHSCVGQQLGVVVEWVISHPRLRQVKRALIMMHQDYPRFFEELESNSRLQVWFGVWFGVFKCLFWDLQPPKNTSSRGVEWVFNGFSNEGFHEFQAFWSVPGLPEAPVGRGFSAVPQVFQSKTTRKWSFGWFLDVYLENGYFSQIFLWQSSVSFFGDFLMVSHCLPIPKHEAHDKPAFADGSRRSARLSEEKGWKPWRFGSNLNPWRKKNRAGLAANGRVVPWICWMCCRSLLKGEGGTQFWQMSWRLHEIDLMELIECLFRPPNSTDRYDIGFRNVL